ncbi:hypothetical protein SAXI111661_13395 [Saccharomonospora xinjiangensis]|uniref:hypothetical protein n=1 Tax=Saccharomonospora xinjiangensis TaxID=75294 RepID=UPI00106F8986|nr:hypothetical protein [Saccharomonospora xinjiangensis]QBQ60631.1 hypothetical protein EYD13_11390 [Saccharomonospora xinjiangensis]
MSRTAASVATGMTPRRLGKRARKATLVTHIATAGVWLGLDVAMAVLVATAWLADDRFVVTASYTALAAVTGWPLLIAGVTCLLSGVVLGLGTRYGLVRYWWVAVKLAIAVVFVALVVVLLWPAVEEAAGQSRAAGGAPSSEAASALLFPPIVSTTGLLVATTLAVVKPWGRIRRR